MARRLKVGAFQFAACDDIDQNLAAMQRGVVAARQERVRLLVLQECAVTGYPPLERPLAETRRADIVEADRLVRDLAVAHDLFIAYGTIAPATTGARNVVRLARPSGGRAGIYAKRALYGWDAQHFVPGVDVGPIWTIDGLRVGARICWEMRFPEHFRELLHASVDIAIVPSCNLGAEEPRRSVAMAHLVSRAVENCIDVVSANSCSAAQASPSCVIDNRGRVLAQAPWDTEALITADIVRDEPTFGQLGILEQAHRLRIQGTPLTKTGVRRGHAWPRVRSGNLGQFLRHAIT